MKTLEGKKTYIVAALLVVKALLLAVRRRDGF